MPGRDPFSDNQIVQILRSAALRSNTPERALRNRAIFAGLISFGVRCSELLQLRVADVCSENWQLRERVTFVHTKNGRPVTLEFYSPIGRKYFAEYLDFIRRHHFPEPGERFFRGNSAAGSLSASGFYRRLKLAAREIGFAGFSGTHSCRKTWALKTYKYFAARARSGVYVDPLLELKKAGHWCTVEAASRYLEALIVDTADCQKSIYSGVCQTLGIPGATPPKPQFFKVVNYAENYQN